MNKYIDADKLKKTIEDKGLDCSFALKMERLDTLALIDELQQEQPEGNLEYWLEHFGMPKENIDNCITQIAQGYGACRYLEGIQHGAEAVNELAKQEQPEVDLEKEIQEHIKECLDVKFPTTDIELIKKDVAYTARKFYELGRARKEE